MSNETATKRIPVKPSTFRDLKILSALLGVTHDECVELLIKEAMGPGDDIVALGKRMAVKVGK